MARVTRYVARAHFGSEKEISCGDRPQEVVGGPWYADRKPEHCDLGRLEMTSQPDRSLGTELYRGSTETHGAIHLRLLW